MFFEQNKKLLIGTGIVALLWIILFYVFVAPLRQEAADKQTEAEQKRAAWIASADAVKEKKDSKHGFEFKPRETAETELEKSSKIIKTKFEELRKMEFGTHVSLHAFSTAAAKGGETHNMVNEKLKQAKQRADTIFKTPIESDKLAARFGEEGTPDALNLLRLALVDGLLSACKEVQDTNTKQCMIDQLVQVDYEKPARIPIPTKEKNPDKEAKDEEESDTPRAKKRGKDKDKDADAPEQIDLLVQIPMKFMVRAPERYIQQLLFELSQPTPEGQKPDDPRRGYFYVKGFNVSATKSNLVEMCIAVTALMRESELKALGIVLDEKDRPF